MVSEKKYIIYGAEPSYYTGKIRCYMRKKGIAFEERSAAHPGFAKAAEKAGSTKIPILVAPGGKVVQDTTDIIDYLEPLFPDFAAYPTSPKQHIAALLLEVFGDECMLRPAMHYRWNFPDDNFPYIFREFGRSMAPQTPMDESAKYAEQFAGRMQSYLPGLGVSDRSIPKIEEAYEELLDLLNEHFRLYPYLLGGRPCLADYGLMGPMYAHLARDVYPSGQMKKRAPFVYRWVERMNVADDGMAEFSDMKRELLPKDALPETLLPVLRYFLRDYEGELSAIVDEVNSRFAEEGIVHGSPVLPEGQRSLGKFKVKYRGLVLDLGVRHFAFYMVQRPIQFYQELEAKDKAQVDLLLDEIGGSDLLNKVLDAKMSRDTGVEIFAA
jgi:glutathione S-transferase